MRENLIFFKSFYENLHYFYIYFNDIWLCWSKSDRAWAT